MTSLEILHKFVQTHSPSHLKQITITSYSIDIPPSNYKQNQFRFIPHFKHMLREQVFINRNYYTAAYQIRPTDERTHREQIPIYRSFLPIRDRFEQIRSHKNAKDRRGMIDTRYFASDTR